MKHAVQHHVHGDLSSKRSRTANVPSPFPWHNKPGIASNAAETRLLKLLDAQLPPYCPANLLDNNQSLGQCMHACKCNKLG